MLAQLNNRFGHYLLLMAASLVMFLANLGGASLWDVDEGRNASCALEMMESGDWIKPTFNGLLRDHKPALLYWLQVGAYHLFGVNEFAARLPSALAALFTVLLTYELGRMLFNSMTGLLGGLIVSSSILLCAAARFANPDALLNLFLVLCFFLFWRGFSQTGKYPYFSLGLAAGLAVLAKGPIGLAMPTAGLVLFLLWIGKLRILWTPRFFLGAASFSLVGLPWYILVCAETKGEFIFGFLLKHNVNRFISPMENHSGGPWFYLLVILVGLAPWSIFLGLTVWYGFWSALRSPKNSVRHWWNAARDTEVPERGRESFFAEFANISVNRDLAKNDSQPLLENRYRFLLCWIGVFLLFFTVAATKLPNYVLPVTTPFALLTARLLDRWGRGQIHIPSWALGLSLGSLALVGLGLSFGLLVASGSIPLIRLKAPALAELRWLALLGLVPIVGALASWWCWRREQRQGVVRCLTLTSLLFLAPLLIWGSEILNFYKAPRPLVEESATLDRTKEIRIIGFKVDHLPSLNFYCQRGIQHCPTGEDAVDYLQLSIPVYVFMPLRDWQQVQGKLQAPYEIVGRHRDLYGAGEVIVVTNQPQRKLD